MLITRITKKMIDFFNGSVHDIEHFLKVHAYAELIGRLEGLDEKTQNTLEMAAVVHDIACPLCREKYGHAGTKQQEEESEALLRPFLAEFDLPGDVLERVIYLVTHHHTVSGIDGLDYQILIEADFLINASERQLENEEIQRFCRNVVRTGAGRQVFASIYPR